MIYVGILAPVLMGFAGLSVDVGTWYAIKRHGQNIVDAGALGGALEVQRSAAGITYTVVAAAATENAILNGYDANNGHSLEINWPPTGGAYRGNTSYVEVIDTTEVETWFAAFFLPDIVNVQARAVAGIQGGDACVYALNPTAPSTFKISGTATIDISCGVYVNSDDPDALVQNGDSCLYATGIAVVGGYSGGDDPCVEPRPAGHMPMLPDPLASLPEPEVGGGCNPANIHVGNGETVTLTPGCYSGNIRVNGDGQLDFAPGTYILDGAGLDIGAQGTVTGDEVFFFMTEENKVSENFNISGGANVSLSAPTSGDYQDVLFFHDREGDPSITHQLTGGEHMDLDGIIYTPSHSIKFAGGSSLNGADAKLIADQLDFVGHSEIGGFSDTLTGLANVDRVNLVE